MAVQPPASPLRSLMKKMMLTLIKIMTISLAAGQNLGKIYNYRFKMCSWAMQIIKVDGMEHQGEENRMGSKRIGWKYRSKPQTHFTHILFIGLAQYNEERS